MVQITKEELLEKLFHDDYQHLKRQKTAHDQSSYFGVKEACMAHIILIRQ